MEQIGENHIYKKRGHKKIKIYIEGDYPFRDIDSQMNQDMEEKAK